MSAPRSKLDLLTHVGLAVAAVLGIASVAHANSAFFDHDEDEVLATPARPTRGARAAKRRTPRVAPAPTIADDEAQSEPSTVDTADAKPDAKTCYNCSHMKRPNEGALPVEKIQGAPRGYHSAQEACYSQAIFEASKRHVASRYRNRRNSAGRCAQGVRENLQATGVFNGAGLGDAIDYQARGRLEILGFKNFFSEFPTPESAPKGAVLVFAGPASAQYITRGQKIYSGGCHTAYRRGRRTRVCSGAGNWAGHVTVAGDQDRRSPSGRWYYTDGRTSAPAVAHRRLIGVYLMQQCNGGCSQALKNRCGG